MELYEIVWKRSALKEIRQIPKQHASRIFKAVDELASNPFPAKVKKLVDSERAFRIRVGDYRVVYNIFDRTLTIEIVRVRHRREVYK